MVGPALGTRKDVVCLPRLLLPPVPAGQTLSGADDGVRGGGRKYLPAAEGMMVRRKVRTSLSLTLSFDFFS